MIFGGKLDAAAHLLVKSTPFTVRLAMFQELMKLPRLLARQQKVPAPSRVKGVAISAVTGLQVPLPDVGVGVGVFVFVAVGVLVLVDVGVNVGVEPVAVAVGVFVFVGVVVGVPVRVGVVVTVGVLVGPVPGSCPHANVPFT